MVKERIAAIKKDAMSTGLIPEGLSLPCSTPKKDSNATTSSAPTPAAAGTTTTAPVINADLNATAPAPSPKTPKRKHTAISTTASQATEDADADTDTDPDSLEGLEETPRRDLKRQRHMPMRASRLAGNSYAVDPDDAAGGEVRDAGAVDEEAEEDEYDPFADRREQEKSEARAQRVRKSYAWLKRT